MRRLAVLVLLLIGLVACGGLSAKEQKAADNLSREFQSGGLTAKDADCLAQGWVGDVGTPQLVKAGVLTKDLTPAKSNRTPPSRDVVDPYVKVYFDCVDYGTYEAAKFDRARPHIIEKDKFAACANDIDKSDAKDAMRDDLLGRQSPVSASVQHQLIQCATVR